MTLDKDKLSDDSVTILIKECSSNLLLYIIPKASTELLNRMNEQEMENK